MTRTIKFFSVFVVVLFLFSVALAQQSQEQKPVGEQQTETTTQNTSEEKTEKKEKKKEDTSEKTKKEEKKTEQKQAEQKDKQQNQQQQTQESEQSQQSQPSQQQNAQTKTTQEQANPVQNESKQMAQPKAEQKNVEQQPEQQPEKPKQAETQQQETQPANEQAPVKSEEVVSKQGEQEPSVEKKAEKKKGKSKWFSMSLTYQFMHNIAKERPVATNLISVDPRFKLPWGFNLSVHLGASWSVEYGRTTSTTDEADWDYRYAVSNKAFHTVDFDVTVLTLSRKIAGYKFNDKVIVGVGGALSLFVPYTSRFQGVVPKWYFAYKPSVKGYLKLGDFKLSDSVAFQQNFHEADFRVIEAGGLTMLPAVQFAVSNAFVLSWSKWGISAMGKVGTKRSWFYTYDLDPLYERAAELDYPVSERVSWNYTVEVGYDFSQLKKAVLEHFSVSAGFTTAGPERRNGGFGNDRVYPFDPLFTSFYLGITASF